MAVMASKMAIMGVFEIAIKMWQSGEDGKSI
jgi:hypothetical protein